MRIKSNCWLLSFGYTAWLPDRANKEKDCGGKEGVCHLQNQRRKVTASAQWSISWTYQLARLCTHVHKGVSRLLWACLSCPSVICFHCGVNEPNKLIAVKWRVELLNYQWVESEFRQKQRVLIMSWLIKLYAVWMKQIYYMIKWPLHVLKVIWALQETKYSTPQTMRIMDNKWRCRINKAWSKMET